MADTKITALTALTAADPANDVIPIVDVNDTIMAGSGTTKKISINNILGASGTATLASATITGDLTVDTSTLKVVSASDVVGINTTSPLTGNDAGLTIGAIGTVKALNIGLQNTFARLREKDAIDAFAITTNITASNTQDDATKSSWKARMGFGNGNDNFIISRSGVGSTTFYDLLAVSTGSCVWYDGAGGTRMTLNSTGLGVGIAPDATKSTRLSVYQTGDLTDETAPLSVGNTAAGGMRLYAGVNNTNEYVYIGSVKSGTGYRSLILQPNGGNVGIGVTPSAWTLKSVQIVNGGIYGSGNETGYYANAFYGSSGWRYINAAGASGYLQNGGSHQWYRSTSANVAGTDPVFTQAMTLDASGNLLVGKTATNLQVIGCELKADGTVFSTLFDDTNAAASSYQLYSTKAATYRFYVGMGGTVFATNTTISGISDARLKENVQDIDVGLGAILALKPRKFDWKAGKGKDIKGDRGFIAQEFEEVFPNLIDEWKDAAPEGEAPYKSVRQDLIPVLVKAIQELAAEVNALKNA